MWNSKTSIRKESDVTWKIAENAVLKNVWASGITRKYQLMLKYEVLCSKSYRRNQPSNVEAVLKYCIEWSGAELISGEDRPPLHGVCRYESHFCNYLRQSLEKAGRRHRRTICDHRSGHLHHSERDGNRVLKDAGTISLWQGFTAQRVVRSLCTAMLGKKSMICRKSNPPTLFVNARKS